MLPTVTHCIESIIEEKHFLLTFLISKENKKADGIKMEFKLKMVNLDSILQTYGSHYIKKEILALKKKVSSGEMQLKQKGS